MSETAIIKGMAAAIWVKSDARGIGGRKWSDVTPPRAADKAAQDLAKLLAAANGVGGNTPMTLLLERVQPSYDDKLFGRFVALRCMGDEEPPTRRWNLNWVKFSAEVIQGELVWEGDTMSERSEMFGREDYAPHPHPRLDQETIRQLRLLRQEAGNMMGYEASSRMIRRIDKALETGNVDPETAEWLG
jgi:hypothetical protein